jgi:sugar/nucleoside kinase (ribokinase family)
MIDSYPEEGNLANITALKPPANGGAPYNVLLDLARLKVDLPLQGIGVLGDDENADFILNDCRAHGIDTELLVKKEGLSTSFTDVFNVESTGHRTFFHNRGANAHLDIDHFNIDKISGRIILLGYLLLLDSLDAEDAEFGTRGAKLLKKLSDAGLETAIDVVSENSDRFAKIVFPALPYVDYLIINEVEVGKIVKLPVRNQSDSKINMKLLEKAAEIMLEEGVRKRVIVHFPEGAYSYSKEGKEKIFVPSLKLPSGFIKGATGAGDAFCAGCLYGLYSGWETERILKFGSGMAAACLSNPASSEGIKPYDEIMAIIDKYDV